MSQLLAIDVGNSRIKFGLFDTARAAGELPRWRWSHAVSLSAPVPWKDMAAWAFGETASAVRAIVAGANPAGIERLLADWPEPFPKPRVIRGAGELPLKVNVAMPEKVGIDRLLNAVAANVLRPADRPAIVIDTGTATTVDLISANRAFEGGAILPGFELAAHALHDYTALLPLVPATDLAGAPPAALGRNTRDAIRSGLFWGQLGAVRELVTQLSAGGAAQPFLLLTGGAAPLLAPHFAAARWEADLPLKGLALACVAE